MVPQHGEEFIRYYVQPSHLLESITATHAVPSLPAPPRYYTVFERGVHAVGTLDCTLAGTAAHHYIS